MVIFIPRFIRLRQLSREFRVPLKGSTKKEHLEAITLHASTQVGDFRLNNDCGRNHSEIEVLVWLRRGCHGEASKANDWKVHLLMILKIL